MQLQLCALRAGVSFFSMHPGWSDTEGVRSSIPGFHKAFKDKLRDTQQGVDTIVWLALEVRGVEQHASVNMLVSHQVVCVLFGSAAEGLVATGLQLQCSRCLRWRKVDGLQAT
jgi:hypothetical protein